MGRSVVICALFSLGVLLLSACQGDYPLAPTNCDRLCEATKELNCGYYDPANCVAGCEEQRMDRPECSEQFSAALVCYEGAEIPCDEDDPYFNFQGPFPCLLEGDALGDCTGGFGFPF